VSIWRRLLAALFLFAGRRSSCCRSRRWRAPSGCRAASWPRRIAETLGAIFPLVVGPLAASVAVGRSRQLIGA